MCRAYHITTTSSKAHHFENSRLGTFTAVAYAFEIRLLPTPISIIAVPFGPPRNVMLAFPGGRIRAVPLYRTNTVDASTVGMNTVGANKAGTNM
mmetsp:Transcript_49450/g.82134  ORF Transcript_49450/g.82134 Transcript_49450/m.82134 type:complete len:94 (+) Transcript_49450:205-486(+)